MDGIVSGKRVVVTGGTGSLGSVLVRRLLRGELGRASAVVVFSRDEAKQHAMRLGYQALSAAFLKTGSASSAFRSATWATRPRFVLPCRGLTSSSMPRR
jgi:uncharacterized protein YbjT (DUF2867 family)